MRRLAVVALLLLVTSREQVTAAGPADAQAVAIGQLIVTPDRFEGKRVRVIAPFHYEFENSAVYASREANDLNDNTNAVWVDLSNAQIAQYKPERLSDEFVLLEGRFTAREQGHIGGWAGVLKEVSRLERALTREEFALVRSELEQLRKK